MLETLVLVVIVWAMATANIEYRRDQEAKRERERWATYRVLTGSGWRYVEILRDEKIELWVKMQRQPILQVEDFEGKVVWQNCQPSPSAPSGTHGPELSPLEKLSNAQADEQKWLAVAAKPGLSPAAAEWARNMARSAAASAKLWQKGLSSGASDGGRDPNEGRARPGDYVFPNEPPASSTASLPLSPYDPHYDPDEAETRELLKALQLRRENALKKLLERLGLPRIFS